MVVWRSIGIRLTAWYTLVLAGMLALAGAGVWAGLRQSVRVTVDRELHTRLSTVETYRARNVSADGPRGNDKWLRELGEDSMVAPGSGILQIADAQGHWLYRSPDAQSWPDSMRVSPDLPASGLAATAVVNRRRFRILTAPLGEAVVQVALSLHAYDEVTEDFFTSALVASPFLLGLAAAAGYWLSRRALRPVDAITETARRISGPTLSSRLPVPRSDDELRRLSITLNDMLDRLELENRRTRQFTADASHELRTPVAVIRATADVTSSRPRTSEEHETAWHIVQEQTRRIAKMIDDLLHLARADAQRGGSVDGPMDLADEVRCACAEMQVLATHAGLTLGFDAPASLPFHGDADAIHRMVGALLDNAVKYTPRGGKIHVIVEARPSADAVVIRVEDTGVGLAADQLAHVFDRFYRVSKDRSRETGGAGLGLAIVKSIALQHGGDATIESVLGRGCIVCVTLPLPDPVHTHQH